MRRLILISMALALTAGCTPKEEDGYGGAGSASSVSGDTGTIPEGDTAEDTGTTGGTTEDGWPNPQDEAGPSQRNPECGFDDFPGIGEVIYCTVEVKDDEGDILGGYMLISLYDTTTDERLEFKNSDELKISDFESDAACLICLDEDELSFAIQNIEDSHNYEMTWSITDKNNNLSNELEITIP